MLPFYYYVFNFELFFIVDAKIRIAVTVKIAYKMEEVARLVVNYKTNYVLTIFVG